MKKLIKKAIKTSKHIDDLKVAVLEVFEHVKKDGVVRIGYVSGIINSDGPKFVKRNMRILREHTEKIRKEKDFPIFSATDVMALETLIQIKAHKLVVKDFIKFWREILESGHVTDIFMTPRWNKSFGATDEHETAKKLGIKIHYLD